MAAKGAVVILALAGAGLAIALGGKKKKPAAVRTNRPIGPVDPGTPDPGTPPDDSEYPDDVNSALGVASQAADTDCKVPVADMQDAWQVLHDYNATDAADDNTRGAEMSLAVDIAACEDTGNTGDTYPPDVQEAITWALTHSDQTNLLEVQYYLEILQNYNAQGSPTATAESIAAQAQLTGVEQALNDFYGAGGTF